MEEEKKDNRIQNDPTRINVGTDDIVNLPKSILNFIKKTISIKDEIEIDESIKSIKEGMDVSGSGVWILICSIIVASVGLNFNSVAVIVGAMLISPLMGPIRAVGLALATNDFKTLIAGLKNFGVMVAFSLITAYIYFKLSPIKEDTSELLGRVKPQAFDILIAFFGGFAGIVATVSNKKSAAMTIVPGVAIATALMPPLCTLSYGLAVHEWNYALGAFYLFLLNSVFICLSTVILLRVLKFPKKAFVNPKTENRVKIYSFVALLLIVIPSVYKTVTIVKESIFKSNADSFISKVVMADDNYMYGTECEYNGGEPIIKIYSNGAEISEMQKDFWKNQLANYDLSNVKIQIKDRKQDLSHFQNLADVKAQLNLIQESNKQLTNENNSIKHKLIEYTSNALDINKLGIRVKNSFPAVKEIFYGKGMRYNVDGTTDTVYTFSIEWKDSININYKKMEADKLTVMLTTELELADSSATEKEINVIW